MHGYKTQQNWNAERGRTWSPPSPDVEGVRTGARWWRSTTTWAGTLKPLRGPVSLTRCGVVRGWTSCSSAAASLESWSWFPSPRNPAIFRNSPMTQGIKKNVVFVSAGKGPLCAARFCLHFAAAVIAHKMRYHGTLYTTTNQSFTFYAASLHLPFYLLFIFYYSILQLHFILFLE